MPALVEGIRKDFPEVATLELDHEGDREGLKKYQRAGVWESAVSSREM